jgi:hypothetical protein
MAGDRRELRTDFVSRDVNTGKTLKDIEDRADAAAEAVDDLGDQADRTGEQLDDLGDDAKQTAALLKGLDVAADQTRVSIRALAREAAQSGNLTLFRDINKQKAELRKLGQLRQILQEAGGDGAEGFSAGFAARVGPLMARAPLSPGLLLAAGAAVPLVASVVAQGVTLGLTGGVVAAGVKVAFADARVKAEAESLGDVVGDVLRDAAAPFVPATIRAVRTARGEFLSLRPVLEDVFADASRYVQPLTEAITGLAREAAPGIRDAVRNAEPLMPILREHGPKAGMAMSSAFRDLSQAAKDSKTNLDALLTTAEATLAGSAKGIALLSNDFWVPPIGRALRDAIADAGPEAVDPLTDSTENLGQSLRGTGMAAGYTAEQLQSYRTALDAAAGEEISAQQAAIALEAAYDDARATIDDNGKTLDVNTAKGRENKQALLDIASAAIASRDATMQQTGSQAAANAVMATARARFIAVATAALGSKEAAEALATSLGLLPSPKPTITLNKQQAERDLATFNAKANNAARDRTVWFTVKQAGSLGAIGQRGFGGPVKANRAYVVGERGQAEVFVPDRDGKILPSVEEYTRGAAPARADMDATMNAARSTAELARRGSAAQMDEERLVRAFARALEGATLRLDDRTATITDLLVRSG